MNRRTRFTGAVLLSLSASAGCAGKSPWGSFSKDSDLPPPTSVGAGDKGDPLSVLAKYDGKDESRFPQPSLQPPKPSGSTASGAGLTGALGSAMAKTKKALTIEPKVERAPDPLSLTDAPPEIGPELHLATARMHESQGNFARADELYRQALSEKPNDLTILVHYARMQDRAGNLNRAAELYRQAIAAHPQEAAAYNDLGLCLARQNRLPEAIECMQKAVQLQGQSVLYRNNLATVLVEVGRNDEALSQLTAVHGPAVGNYNLGYLLHKAGKTEQAASCLRKSLELDPRLTRAESLLAVVTGQPPKKVAALPRDESRAVDPSRLNGQPVFVSLVGPRDSAERPQPLPAVQPEEDWGVAPTPDSLPQLLPPVR